MLTVDISTKFQYWAQEMEQLGVDRNCLAGDSAAVWRTLFDGTVAQLKGGDLRFKPLLYEGEAGDYAARMRALTEWCHGFNYAIGVTGCNLASSLSDASRKFLADIGEIGAADCVALSGDGQAANEAAYNSIAGYLGVGVVMMCDEVISKNESRRLH